MSIPFDNLSSITMGNHRFSSLKHRTKCARRRGWNCEGAGGTDRRHWDVPMVIVGFFSGWCFVEIWFFFCKYIKFATWCHLRFLEITRMHSECLDLAQTFEAVVPLQETAVVRGPKFMPFQYPSYETYESYLLIDIIYLTDHVSILQQMTMLALMVSILAGHRYLENQEMVLILPNSLSFLVLLVLSREWMGIGEWDDYGSFSHSLRLAPVSYWQTVFLVMWLISNLFHELQRPVWTPHMWTINLIAATLMRKWLAVAGGRVPSTSDRMLGVTCLVCLEPEAAHLGPETIQNTPNILHCYIACFFFPRICGDFASGKRWTSHSGGGLAACSGFLSPSPWPWSVKSFGRGYMELS